MSLLSVKLIQALANSLEPRFDFMLGGAFAPQWVRSNLNLWLERADKQLYRAKSGGRNRAEFEPHAVSQVSAEEKGLLFAVSRLDADDGKDTE